MKRAGVGQIMLLHVLLHVLPTLPVADHVEMETGPSFIGAPKGLNCIQRGFLRRQPLHKQNRRHFRGWRTEGKLVDLATQVHYRELLIRTAEPLRLLLHFLGEDAYRCCLLPQFRLPAIFSIPAAERCQIRRTSPPGECPTTLRPGPEKRPRAQNGHGERLGPRSGPY